MMTYATPEHIRRHLAWVLDSPQNRGRVDLLVLRPQCNQRTTPALLQLCPEAGVVGDHWAHQAYKPGDPEVQVAIMNRRMIHVLAGERARWPLAGDQLFVDFDLGMDHLAPGDCLQVGKAVLQITAEPHRGCGKFRQRYGEAALQQVNSPQGDAHRLRGVYAKIIHAGEVRLGDALYKH